MLQDLRFAFRSLRKRPLLFLVPVLSLALGIGANTAIFTLVNSFLLTSPEGIPNADRMIEVGRGRDGRGFDSFSYPDFVDLRREAEPIQELAGYQMQMLTLSRGEAGERVFGMLVSANYFDILGIQPALGRAFLPEEDQEPDTHPVLVLSYAVWNSRMGGDPDVVGSTVYLNRRPYTVVGIAPEGFRGHIAVGDVDVYVPLMQHPSLNEGRDMFERRNASWFQVLGLLRPGATLQQADAAVKTVFGRLAEEYPETNARRTAAAQAYGALPAVIRGPAGAFLGILMAFVGLILLITCANVAGIFLARASGRTREISIRLSIGSSRGRLLRHFLTESLMVFSLGGCVGFLLALWGLNLLSTVEIPAPVPLQLGFSPDWRVVGFSLAVTLGAGLVFGLIPARQAVRQDLLTGLKDGEGRRGSSEGRLRRAFVAAQIGASLVLLVAGGLLLRALQEAGEIEKGFQAEGAFLTFLDLSAEGLDSEEAGVFQEEAVAYFGNQPWTEGVALAIDLPLDLGSHGTGVLPEGWEPSENEPYLGVDFNAVTPGYFSTLQIPVLQGRTFGETDVAGAENVLVISRTFAEQVWPGESPLGRRVLWGASGEDWVTVIGVVENVHNQLLTDEPKPFAYRPLAQYPDPETQLVVRSGWGEAQVAQGIHDGLRSLDANLSLAPVIRLDRYTAVGILPQKVAGSVAAALGFLALLLSGMGVYGVMAFSVTRRTREMGIRAALGANPREVLRMVLGGAFRLALPGMAFGLLAAVGVGHLLRSLLLGVSPLDPWALGSVAAIVGGMVLAGTLVPARRAARVDPAEALRYD
jgi:predicted permease